MSDEGTNLIEIRCLWQRTDYGYISLAAAARGFGGRQLGSYQDAITDERFAQVRDRERQANPEWPLVESVIKVPASSVEALFTDGTEIKAVPSFSGEEGIDAAYEAVPVVSEAEVERLQKIEIAVRAVLPLLGVGPASEAPSGPYRAIARLCATLDSPSSGEAEADA